MFIPAPKRGSGSSSHGLDPWGSYSPYVDSTWGVWFGGGESVPRLRQPWTSVIRSAGRLNDGFMDTKSHETCVDITTHKKPTNRKAMSVFWQAISEEKRVLPWHWGKTTIISTYTIPLLDKTCHGRLILKINRLKGRIISVFPKGLSHVNHSIYGELFAFSRPDQT